MNKSVPNKVVTNTLNLYYNYTAGKILSEFFHELREHGTLMGRFCPGCNEVVFPPRKTCGRCYSLTGDWVKLSGAGVVESFALVRYQEPTLPEKPPYILGQIRMDGTNGGITHLIKGVKVGELKIGMKVKAIIKEERQGDIRDIDHFSPYL